MVAVSVATSSFIGLTLSEVRLGGRRQRDHVLGLTMQEVRLDFLLLCCVEWRMIGLPLLFVHFLGVGEISGHFILQLHQNDLADT